MTAVPERAAGGALLSRSFVALTAMQMTFGLALSTFLLLPKVLASSFGAGATAIGVVTATFGLASVAVVPFLGAHTARHGARPSILVGNLVLAASAFGFALVTSVGPLALVLRALHGLAWTMVFNGGVLMTTQIAPPGRLAQAIGIYGSANLLSNALAPAIAEPLIDRFGYRPVFGAAGVLALLAFAQARRLREPAPTPPAERTSFRALLGRPPVARLATIIVVTGIGLGVMFTFHQPFALALGMRNVRGFFVGYTAGSLLVRLGAGQLADRLGHRRVTVASLLLYAAVVAAMSLLAPGRLGALGFVFGVAHGLFLPAIMALSIRGAPSGARGPILAVMNGGLAAGSALTPLLGAVADAVGYPVVFVATALLVLGAAFAVPR